MQPEVAATELVRAHDGARVCVNGRTCGARIARARALAAFVARRYVPRVGWVGRVVDVERSG